MKKMPDGSDLSLIRISCDRNRGWKLSESTPLFQRRILLAGHQTGETSGGVKFTIFNWQ